MTDYVYAEPEMKHRQVFMDTRGNPHLTREDAIDSNIRHDAETELRAALVPAIPDDHDQRGFAARKVMRLIKQKPQLFRDLIDTYE